MRKFGIIVAMLVMVAVGAYAQTDESGRLVKEPTTEDLKHMQEGDKIVADLYFGSEVIWVVERKTGGFDPYWGNIDSPYVWKNGEAPVPGPNGTDNNPKFVTVCGEVYCCDGIVVSPDQKKCVPAMGPRWPKP